MRHEPRSANIPRRIALRRSPIVTQLGGRRGHHQKFPFEGFIQASLGVYTIRFQPDSRRLPKVKSFSRSIFGAIVPRRVKQVDRV